MGWNFRKSTKIGPFRFTTSKSGTSVSVGTKGYRVTRQANGAVRKTYSIPGTGISYTKTVKPAPSHKMPSPSNANHARMMAEQWLKTVTESAQLCNETVRPEVFFSRYALLLEKLRQLSELEQIISFSGEKPSDAYRRVVSQKSAAIHNLIERSYQREIEETAALKTLKGQWNHMKRYSDSFRPYVAELGEDNFQYLNGLLALGVPEKIRRSK